MHGEGEPGAAVEMGACLDEAQQLSPQKQEKKVDLTTTCLHAVHVEDGIAQVTVTGSWYRLLTKDEIGQVYAVSPIWYMCCDVLRPQTLVAENLIPMYKCKCISKQIPGNRQCADCKRSALGPDGKVFIHPSMH